MARSPIFKGRAQSPGVPLVCELLAGFTYKPGWEFAVFTSHPREFDPNPYLDIKFPAPNSCGPGHTTVYGRRQIPYYLESRDQAVRWLYYVILEMERHETDEWFKINGVAPFDPHRKERELAHGT